MSTRRAAVAAIVLALVASLSDCKKETKADPFDIPAPALVAPRGDFERGHALIAEFGCNRCHDDAGLAAAPIEKHCVHCHQEIMAGTYDAPKATLAKWQKIIVDLRDAPSLGETSARLRRGWIEKFLLDPRDLRPHLSATMPRLAITQQQARDIATYFASEDEAPVALGGARRGPRQGSLRRERMRDVPRVGRRARRDGDADPGARRQPRTRDGARARPATHARSLPRPGNTGGFGFKGRGLNVAEYEGIASGALDDDGQRRSIFAAMEGGSSRLVRALLARRGEERGENDATMRGMPLGLPALSPEDLQLVESWIAQGRPR